MNNLHNDKRKGYIRPNLACFVHVLSIFNIVGPKKSLKLKLQDTIMGKVFFRHVQEIN